MEAPDEYTDRREIKITKNADGLWLPKCPLTEEPAETRFMSICT